MSIMLTESHKGALDLVRLSGTQWRVTDHVELDEPFSVLCYIDDCVSHVEVVWLRPHRGTTTHPDFDSAMRAIRGTCLHS